MKKHLSALAILVFLSHPLLAAQRAYVTDQLEIQLRAGQTMQHKILKMLPSGMAVTVLDRNEASGYSLVRAESGEQGWVLSRYLSETPVARTLNEKLTAEIAEIRQSAANVIQVQADRDRLRQNLASVEKELADARAEIESSSGDVRREWFLIGAGVLTLGIILGLLLPRLAPRKKSNWGSF